MSERPETRGRNKRWLFAVLREELTIREIAAIEGMTEKQVRRGIEDAATYREIHESSRRLAWARGLANSGGSFLVKAG